MSTSRAPWSAPVRWTALLAGLVVALAASVLGATEFALSLQGEQVAGWVALGCFAIALCGAHVAVAGIWRGWRPPSEPRRRARAVRVLLGWTMLVAAYMSWGLPVLEPRTMTGAEWISLLTLTALTAGSATAAAYIGRRPRFTAWLLAPLGAYGAFLTVKLLWALARSSGQFGYPGPSVVLSYLLAASCAITLLAAAVLAWPMRRATPEAT